MRSVIKVLRKTRRFRLTLLVVLLFGFALASGLSESQVQPPQAASTANDSAAAPAAEQGARTDTPAPSTDPAAPDAQARAPFEKIAEEALFDLTKRTATEPAAEDTKVPAPIVELFFKDESDDTTDLRDKFETDESSGKYIHYLRKLGLVPAASVRWLSLREAEGEVDLLGIVAVDDKPNDIPHWEPRSKSVKVTFKKADGSWRISGLTRPTAEELGGAKVVETFLDHISKANFEAAWASGSNVLRRFRDAAKLEADLATAGLGKAESYRWGTSTDLEGGFKLNGVAILAGGVEIPFYAALQETPDGLMVLDIQQSSSFFSRVFSGRGDGLDMSLLIFGIALIMGFLYILFSYWRGLLGTPRELYILFFTKVTEYSAYGAANLAFMFYLREDLGLSEIGAGSYITAWSTSMTLTMMVVGAVCDAIGVKKTLLIGSFALILSRVVMPFTDNFWMATLLGFFPLAVGIAITGPVLSVGIKRFTTLEGSALGFGLFYTLLNVGWAVGAYIFDSVRVTMGQTGTLELLGSSLSTWQVIIGIGFFINLPDLVVILLMRDGIEMTENGIKLPKAKVSDGTEGQTSLMTRAIKELRRTLTDTAKIFASNFAQTAFWVFILLITVTVFAKLVFFHFHYTWPSYGVRYFGQGSLVGSIFGVLNPVMIIFLTPTVAYATRKIRPYWMLLLGTLISAASVIFVVVPPEAFIGLVDTWFGEIVLGRWLEVPVGYRDPFYISMVLFVGTFTIGEAIWSPRLMQFTAEIAPPGREGSYISLSYLPYFGAKFIAGPMAGMLLTSYTPEFGIDGVYGNYPDHQLVWWWIGGTAILTPIGLLVFRKLYRIAEERADADARAAAAEVGESA